MMTRSLRLFLITTALLLPASAPSAADLALVLGIERYEQLDRLPRGADVTASVGGLTALGFGTLVLRNGRTESAAETLAAFIERVPEAERILVVLSGRFATDGRRTWLLTADAAPPGILSPGEGAISVESILAVLSRAPGRALLLLGAPAGAGDAFDPWLRAGIGTLDIPQGVTVVRGEPAAIARFLAEELSRPEGDLAAALRASRGLTAEGFLPDRFVFMPPEPTAEDAGPQPPAPDPAVEDAVWARVVAQDNVEAYQGYLRQYPMGRYAAEAEAAIEAILAEPFRDARLAEEALNLSRAQRRDIQSDLTLLGFSTGGVDGIFGNNTRRAITNWQQENGFAQTSYLTAEQISRLDAQAARRAAEIAAQEERARQEALRLDRAYWEETGARGDEAGLRAYLQRYPSGLFSEVAAERLARIEEQRQQELAQRDRAAWNAARRADTVEAYRGYLREFPQGAFAAEANRRIAELTTVVPLPGPVPDDESAAAEAERLLGLNALTARMVEARLDALGLNPGTVDGRFDAQTRRAIRRYQVLNGIAETGYLDQVTVLRLLSDALRD